MLSKTRSPKPAVKQQALGTAPAEGSRQGLFRGSTICSAAYLLYKGGAGRSRVFGGKDWSQGRQGNGTALRSRLSQLTQWETGERGKVPWLKAVRAEGRMQSFPPSLSGGLCVLANCTSEWGEGGSCLGPQRRLFPLNERHPSISVLWPLDSKPCLASWKHSFQVQVTSKVVTPIVLLNNQTFSYKQAFVIVSKRDQAQAASNPVGR